MSQATEMLEWGVKASFRDYLSGLDDCEIQTLQGAVQCGSGVFGWPVQTRSATQIDTSGVVLIRAHGGFLEVQLKNPSLQWSGTDVTFSVEGPTGQLVIAQGSLASTDPLRAELVATLDGSTLLGSIYPQGTMLDECALISVNER